MTMSESAHPGPPPGANENGGPPKTLFATSFWGENDKGLDALMARMRAGKHVAEEVHQMLKERALIEEDYGKRLKKLSKAFNPKEEIGTLRDSLDILRAELDKTGQARLDLANEIRAKLEKPLVELIATQAAVRKSHNATVRDHLKNKAAQAAAVSKIKERYESKCAEANQLMQARPGVHPKEAEKIKAKLEKTQTQAKNADQEYVAGVDRLGEIHKRWEQDFRTCCMECQRLEEDRFHFLRAGIWNYANFLAGICIADDESCERIRTSLEACDFGTDVKQFVTQSATGSEIPEPLQYINFYTGTKERPTSSTPGSRNSITESFDRSSSATSLPKGGPTYNTDTGSTAPTAAYNSPDADDVRQSSYSPEPAQRESLYGGSDGGPGMTTLSRLAAAYADPDDGGAETFTYDPYDVPESMPVLFSVRVLYDYAAQAHEELSIAKGQIVPVIATHDDGTGFKLG
ncbi:hypothetical protein HK104_011122 [Borealophlyctis nickersoniae]|nr:hypothetical protein HK104_011122 [Borealophlyctis nickersoniae]